MADPQQPNDRTSAHALVTPVEEMPASGNLADWPVPRLYCWIAAEARGGALELGLEGRRCAIHFKRGTPVAVESDAPDDQISTFLRARGALPPERLAAAEQAAAQYGGSVVSALIGLRWLDPSQAFRLIGEHGKWLLGKALAATSGTFVFNPGRAAPQTAMQLGDRFGLLCEAVRALSAAELRARLGNRLYCPVLRSGGRIDLQQLKLNSQEVRAAAWFDGVRPLHQLCQALPAESDALLRTAWLLANADLVSFVGADKAPSMPAPERPPPPADRLPPTSPGSRVQTPFPPPRLERVRTPTPPVVPAPARAAAAKRPEAQAPAMSPGMGPAGPARGPGAPAAAAWGPPPAKEGPPASPPSARPAAPGSAPSPASPARPAASVGSGSSGSPTAKASPGAPARAGIRPDPAPSAGHPPPSSSAAPSAASRLGADVAALRAFVADMTSKNHFEILGLAPGAQGAQIKKAYFELAKAVHPDTLPANAPRELAKLRGEVFARIGEAYRVLSDDARRAAYLEELKSGTGGEQVDASGILAAEEVFRRGCVLVKAHRPAEALALFEEAVNLNPQEGEFQAWRAWARFLAEKDKAAGRSRAIRELEAAIRMNPRCAMSYYFVGQVLKLTGGGNAALKWFRKTVELDPTHIDARREIRMAER